MRTISSEIYSPGGKALGDCWGIINYHIQLGMEKNETIRLAVWYRKGNAIKRTDKLAEILPLFENDDFIQLVELEPTVPVSRTSGYVYSFAPTKIKWKPNSSKKICYQFDAKSKTAARFPDSNSQDEILNHVHNLGYEVVRLNWERSLKECVTEVANCEIFLGVDSGMATLAASVGAPLFFCRNNRPIEVWETFHSKKHFILTKDHTELIYNIDMYAKNGLSYYINNAKNINIFKDQLERKNNHAI